MNRKFRETSGNKYINISVEIKKITSDFQIGQEYLCRQTKSGDYLCNTIVRDTDESFTVIVKAGDRVTNIGMAEMRGYEIGGAKQDFLVSTCWTKAPQK